MRFELPRREFDYKAKVSGSAPVSDQLIAAVNEVISPFPPDTKKPLSGLFLYLTRVIDKNEEHQDRLPLYRLTVLY